MQRLWNIIALVFCTILLILTGCDSDNGTGPSTATNSSAAFILNGSPYSNTSVDLRDKTGGIWLIQSDDRMIGMLDVLASFNGTSTNRVLLTLTIPASHVGTYDWIDPKGAVLSNSGVFLEIQEPGGVIREYQAVQGSTVVALVGAETAQVDGTFTGSLRSTSDGSIITISNGVFSITRLKDQ
ncbi:MAG: hypothetical protein WBQ23_06410 [Bacteroidota bacterium]